MERPRVDLHLLVILGLAAAFYSGFTQTAPYHLDTVGYLESAKAALATRVLPSPAALRFFNIYCYIPFVWLFGDVGIKVMSVAFFLTFITFYYLTVRCAWGARVAFAASLMMISIPATVITVTHLKEDFIGLSLVVLALWLLRPRPSVWRGGVAGSLFGLACLSKELPLILLPVMLVHIGLNCTTLDRYRDLFRLAWLRRAMPVAGLFVAAWVASILILSPRFFAQLLEINASPYLGHFLGLGSQVQRRGAQFWTEGMLFLAVPHLVLIPLAVWAAWRRNVLVLLWLAAALWTFLFTSNTAGVRGRVFVMTALFSVPLICLAIERAVLSVVARKAAPADARSAPAARGRSRPARSERSGLGGRQLPAVVLYGATAILAVLQLGYVLPTLMYRLAYPPHAEFYGGLRAVLPANALLVGMDDCVLARHYTKCPCLVAPVDPDAASARTFVAGLRESLATRSVCALPDLFSYDKAGQLARAVQEAMRSEDAYVGVGENYHFMTYGRRMPDELKDIARAGCTVAATERRRVAVNAALTLDLLRLHLTCRGRERTMHVFEYRGVRTYLEHRTVTRLAAVDGSGQR